MNQVNTRLPVKREVRPPALWQQAAPAVVRATALVAAGIIGEWVLRRAAQKAVTAPFKALSARPGKAVAKRSGNAGDVIAEETIVVRRRVFFRR